MIKITDDKGDLEVAFDTLEGKGFFKRSISKDDGYSLMTAIRCHQEGMTMCVYGNGGYHRYYLSIDGRLTFSGMHSNWPNDRCQDAEDVGFEVT